MIINDSTFRNFLKGIDRVIEIIIVFSFRLLIIRLVAMNVNTPTTVTHGHMSSVLIYRYIKLKKIFYYK